MATRLRGPRAAIVASGSELVRGDRGDRNGPFLAASLLRLGIDPARITIVGDDPGDLEAALAAGLEHDLLVTSGGLGPTHDDRTIELLARAAGVGLAVDEELAAAIEQLSRGVAGRLGRPYTDFEHGVRKQAMLPAGALWVGLVGTAPAVVLEHAQGVAVALPGPPRELQELWPRVLETQPLRRLLERASAPERRVLRLFGVSESAVAQALAAAGGEGQGVDVTICAREFELHIDLLVQPGAEARADELERQLVREHERFLFSRDERSTAELVLALLRGRGLTLATAESCTGGLVAARLTDVARASDVFLGAVVAYANDVKAAQLGVPEEVLREHGAVSAETAAADGAGRTRASRCRRRGVGDGCRRPRRRHAGEAGRPRLPARLGTADRALAAARRPRRPGDDPPALDRRRTAPRAPTRHTVGTDLTHLPR